MESIVAQGRRWDETQRAEIRAQVGARPDRSRRRLAEEPVRRWDRRNAAGRRKDMSCRKMPARLEAKRRVRLPSKRRQPGRDRKRKAIPAVAGVDQSPWPGPPAAVQPVQPERVDYGTAAAALFDHLPARHHYPGYAYPVGANVRYLARGRDGRVLACAVWASAALKAGARDRRPGWTPARRLAGLARVSNNTRFLILPQTIRGPSPWRAGYAANPAVAMAGPPKRGRPACGKVSSPPDRIRDRRLETLRFLHEPQVPWSENQAERDIRMMKVRQKVSGGFRTAAGAMVFCRIRSYPGTLRKNRVEHFDGIVQAPAGQPWLPPKPPPVSHAQAPPNSPRAKVAARAVTVKQGQPPSRAMFCARKRANLRQRRE